MSQRVTHEDVIDHLLKERYGKDFDSFGDAVQDMFNKPHFSGIVGLEILKRLDAFCDAFADRALRKMLSRASESMNLKILNRIVELQDKHGPCPDSVKRFINRQAHAEMGRRIGWFRPEYNVNLNDINFPIYDRPPKDHPARAEYDRYVRRKVKKDAN